MNVQSEHPDKPNLIDRSSILLDLLGGLTLSQNTLPVIQSYSPRRKPREILRPLVLPAITLTYNNSTFDFLIPSRTKILMALLRHLTLALLALNRPRSNYLNEHSTSWVAILPTPGQDVYAHLPSVHWRPGSSNLQVLQNLNYGLQTYRTPV